MPLLARRAASATERTLVYFRTNMYIRPPMRLSSSPTHQSISGRCRTRTYFRDGSKAALPTPKSNFRFTPESGLKTDIWPCQFRAMCGRLRVGKDFLHVLQHWSVQPHVFGLLTRFT